MTSTGSRDSRSVASGSNRPRRRSGELVVSVRTYWKGNMLQKTKSILFGSLLGILIPSLALGQTATLLPNAKQQYLDDSGTPVSSGTAGYYVPGSTTNKK